MNKSRYVILVIFIICLVFSFINIAYSKDIDLDSIYIKKESILYKRLVDSKIDAYQAVNSLYIDKDVIFADWISGHQILYIKELPEINIIYIYSNLEHNKNEIIKIPGTITSVLFSTGGKYLFLKRLLISDDYNSKGETLILNLSTAKLSIEKSPHFFMNLTLSSEGNTILYEDNKGIIEFNPELNRKSLFIPNESYSDIISTKYNTLAYVSPNKQKILLVNGSGGYYNSKLVSKEGIINIKGITSSTEIAWLNNNLLAYRFGNTGNFSIIIYDIKFKTMNNIITNSLNTNLHLSIHAGIISFLKNQIIHIYKIRENKLFNIGIEGEDIVFSPDGNLFVSLMYKKLFLTNFNFIEKRNLLLKNNSKVIFSLYKMLLNRNGDWTNEYTYSYLIRKFEDYKFLAGE